CCTIGGGVEMFNESSYTSGSSDWWDSSTSSPQDKSVRLADKSMRKEQRTNQLSIQQYVDTILRPLRELKLRILLEPGRLLVGNAGVLLTRVRYIKRTGQKKFAIVDAGMNDLIRPALYHSYHEIVPVKQTKSERER